MSRLLLPPLLLLQYPLGRRLLVRALLEVRHQEGVRIIAQNCARIAPELRQNCALLQVGHHRLLVAHPRDAVDAVAARRRRRRGERRRGGEGREQPAPRDPLPLDGNEREVLEQRLRDEVVREAVSTEW